MKREFGSLATLRVAISGPRTEDTYIMPYVREHHLPNEVVGVGYSYSGRGIFTSA